MKTKVWLTWEYGRSLRCFLFGHIFHWRYKNIPYAEVVNNNIILKCDRCKARVPVAQILPAPNRDIDIA